MMRPLSLVLLLVCGGVARGQAMAPVVADPADSVLQRAERMAGEGHAAAARLVVDSVLAATPPGSPQYAEVLFTRASLSATAFETERDYRRITVEYPSSLRADDALLRLAQLELARGSKDEARAHLLRLERDRAPAQTPPRTNLSIAHAWFAVAEPEHACAALDAAHQAAPPTEVEFIHQLDYAGQPCARLPKAVAVKPAVTPKPAAPAAPAVKPDSAAAASVTPVSARRRPRVRPPPGAPATRREPVRREPVRLPLACLQRVRLELVQLERREPVRRARVQSRTGCACAATGTVGSHQRAASRHRVLPAWHGPPTHRAAGESAGSPRHPHRPPPASTPCKSPHTTRAAKPRRCRRNWFRGDTRAGYGARPRRSACGSAATLRDRRPSRSWRR